MTVWLVVGTNATSATPEPTWFYTFRSAKIAHEFIKQAKALTNTVTWCEAPYPCEVDTLSSGLDAFKQALAAPDP